MNLLLSDCPGAARGGWRKVLAMLGAALFLGGVVWLSHVPGPVTPVAAAHGAKEQPSAATISAVAAATAFLDALDAGERGKALFEFDSPKKPNWSNLPVTTVPRNGVRLGDLTPAKRSAALAVVAALLSQAGYQKVIDILDSDQVLVDERGGRPESLGKDQYYLAIFGKPSPTEPWMVQFGGHHLGLNVTVIGKHFILTPTHTGTQPALFKRAGKEVRPLGAEIDAGFKLVNALDDKQKARAIIAERPQGELLLGPGRDGRRLEPKGIKGSALSAEQQALLLEVIAAWVNIVEPDSAAAWLAAIKAQLGETWFAWMGPTEMGKAVYFRVQGPRVVIEYAPQGNTDHIHTVIRNPENDYGAGVMKR